MSNNICGNCANFKPKPGEKFFNCTKAIHAGVDYGMQVRADTRSCDAFEPMKAPAVPKPAPKAIKAPAKATPQAARLCPWGRLILLAAIILIILLLSWGIYTCAKNAGGGPAPTPRPKPTPTSTKPTPTPIPTYIYQDYEIGKWAEGVTQSVLVHSPVKSSKFTGSAGTYEAPEGTDFVWFEFTAINISNKPNMRIIASSFWISDSKGRVYLAAGNPVYYPLRYESIVIYTGETGKGVIPYMVPAYARGLKVNYVIQGSAVQSTVARWKLPW